MNLRLWMDMIRRGNISFFGYERTLPFLRPILIAPERELRIGPIVIEW